MKKLSVAAAALFVGLIVGCGDELTGAARHEDALNPLPGLAKEIPGWTPSPEERRLLSALKQYAGPAFDDIEPALRPRMENVMMVIGDSTAQSLVDSIYAVRRRPGEATRMAEMLKRGRQLLARKHSAD